ncbi:hypothetical protein K469DRAFT_687599 [Zopfia rhizophila CBS 207.26]|uniref:Uncharacterized protein n=1 Tax=Zopfia rhizophila CBS 207.26 TaxID=1314779 RepID=A0A6A6E1S5_9PEZI|nr:hypothetical protein K469DRAFT_687599 [Zopfia rhizophila CBS 207.26]
MASKLTSKAPNRTKSEKPSIKKKPAGLQGVSLSTREWDYLNANPLEDDGDGAPPSLTNMKGSLLPLRNTKIQISMKLNPSKTGKNMSNISKVQKCILVLPGANAEHQWGEGLSPEAVTTINTKLELDIQDNKPDELGTILQVLEGMNNLSFEHDQRINEFGQRFRDHLPVDIIITVPVNWSYLAKNSILRAIMAAGFNEDNFPNLRDIMMVTESKAAAIHGMILEETDAEGLSLDNLQNTET